MGHIYRESTLTAHVYLLDPTSGKERSVFNYDGGMHDPAVSGSLVYFNSHPFLYAVDVSSGEVKWKFETKEASGNSYPLLLGDKVVYSAFSGYGLYAVDRQTGKLRWTLKSEDLLLGNISAGKLYVVRKSSVLALNPDTGEVIWSTRVGFDAWIKSVVDGVVYASNRQALIAIDSLTGKKLWKFKTSFKRELGLAGILGAGDYAEYCSPPTKAGELLLFSTSTARFWGAKKTIPGHLYAIDSKTGKLATN